MDMGKNGYTALISRGSSEIGLGIATKHALVGIHLATASRTSTRYVLEEAEDTRR